MASFKDTSVSRPLSSGLPTRPQRQHSHSISMGAVNPSHRVTRRKSMNTSIKDNSLALSAALKEGKDTNLISSLSTSHRRSMGSRKGLESSSMGAPSSFGSYLVRGNSAPRKHQTPDSIEEDETAVTETTNGSTDKNVSTKNRSRRASEGSHLVKGEGKRVSSELRCDRCGKGYKHSSCLTKHMWEHDPAWAYTSKLLISKHQQVQLLEAATVLVNMNVDPETSGGNDSDESSASPTASGASDIHDGMSSVETTPPPTGEEGYLAHGSYRSSRMKRLSGFSGYSRSYQSIPSNSYTGSVTSPSPRLAHFRHGSVDQRNILSDDDEAGLAAAVELCNFGTPRTGPVQMSGDVPPVPPLPARYLSQSHSSKISGSLATPTGLTPLDASRPRHLPQHSEEDDRMDYDDDFSRRREHQDDDDDGIFGRMEE